MTAICYHDFPFPRRDEVRRCRNCGVTAADFTREAVTQIPALRRRIRGSSGVPLEKDEQQQIVALLRKIGATWYEIGRPRAQKCWKCGAVTKDQGTRQTPGIPDLYVFLPVKNNQGPILSPTFLWVEAKRAKGSKVSDEQRDFRAACELRGIPHVLGSYTAVVDWLLAHHFVEAA